jgi:hypothetical protein
VSRHRNTVMLIEAAADKFLSSSYVSSSLPPDRRWSRSCSREAVVNIGKLQDRFPRVGISQLCSHLPRLFGTFYP